MNCSRAHVVTTLGEARTHTQRHKPGTLTNQPLPLNGDKDWWSIKEKSGDAQLKGLHLLLQSGQNKYRLMAD